MTTYEQVLNILNEHDPMGLISMGAPEDEYVGEAKKIYDSMGEECDLSTLSDTVFSVFRKSFSYDHEKSLIPDIPTSRERFRKVASDILAQQRP